MLYNVKVLSVTINKDDFQILLGRCPQNRLIFKNRQREDIS